MEVGRGRFRWRLFCRGNIRNGVLIGKGTSFLGGWAMGGKIVSSRTEAMVVLSMSLRHKGKVGSRVEVWTERVDGVL